MTRAAVLASVTSTRVTLVLVVLGVLAILVLVGVRARPRWVPLVGYLAGLGLGVGGSALAIAVANELLGLALALLGAGAVSALLGRRLGARRGAAWGGAFALLGVASAFGLLLAWVIWVCVAKECFS